MKYRVFANALSAALSLHVLGCGGDDSTGCTADDCAPAKSDVGAHIDAGHDAATVVEASTCVPEAGPDVPDDDFTDTNCDGIDGDKSHAIFVSPTGSDTAPGTIDLPVQTLSMAVALGAGEGKDVYVCNGTYEESLVLSGVIAASLYGGYDCTKAWTRSDTTFVVQPGRGIPFQLSGTTRPLAFDRATLIASDGTNPSDSSIAALVSSSASISFHRVVFQAGNGAPGTAGVPAATWSYSAFDGINLASQNDDYAMSCARGDGPSCDALVDSGENGFPAACTSQGDSTGPSGGTGGQGAVPTSPTFSPARPSPGMPYGSGGATTATAGLSGTNGSSGANGEPGGGVGTFSLTGYQPTNVGTNGSPGGMGGGGGGGAGASWGVSCGCQFEFGGSGGAGGSGGCGGYAGNGGGAGGASIGLLSFGSTVATSNCAFNVGHGGTGGAPSGGSAGQPGGVGGGGGYGAVYGCSCVPDEVGELGYSGGNGGTGGFGGGGGGGGGGPSLGIAAIGGNVTAAAATFDLGAGGEGGQPPFLATGAPGTDGLRQEILTQASAADAGPDAP